MAVNLRPLAACGLAGFGGECLGGGLEDAASALALVEEVVELVGGGVDDVTVDGGRTIVEEELGFTDEVGEVVVHIGVVDAVERLRVACSQ